MRPEKIYTGYIVTLTTPVSEETMCRLGTAIRQIKYVKKVVPLNTCDEKKKKPKKK